MTPQQLIQQTAHGQIMVSGTQPPQLSTTPGGLVTTPSPMMLVQSGMTPQVQAQPGGMYSHLQVAGVMPQVGQNQGRKWKGGGATTNYTLELHNFQTDSLQNGWNCRSQFLLRSIIASLEH